MSWVFLLVALPLGGGFLLPLFDKRWAERWLPRGSEALTLALTLATAGLAFATIGWEGIYRMGGWSPPLGINLVVDGLSSLMLVVINSIALLVTIYSFKYMEDYTPTGKYYSLFLLMLAGMNGVILTGDMFNLFVFLEIASIASYALVGYRRGAVELEAAFKYLILGSIGSAFIIFGVGLLYAATGQLNMAQVSRNLAGQGRGVIGGITAAFFLVGFGLKAAQVPFHAWLPDAHSSAPSPISAILSGVLIKALGVYCLARVFFNVLGIDEIEGNILMWGGTLSMVVGALLAVGQEDLKRLLAYSSISQVGYIVLALGMGGIMLSRGEQALASLALVGALFHLINHAANKALLFLASGAIEEQAQTRQLGEMGGLFHRMPVTGTTTLCGVLSIAGIPPFAGFWSKLIIIVAALWGGFYAVATLLIATSVLTLAYYMRVEREAFFGAVPERLQKVKEAPAAMAWAMGLLAAGAVGLGVLYLPGLREMVLQPAMNVLLEGLRYAQMVLGG
ncbi:MAG: NADH/ubiquinone/plastoquinone (complex I) [Candidatus Acetothermia bacterium]|jgi:multicomponent Na+:H+ antiporter subunit D|nr:NADH/ubiquinone/plastoquinone (complex I) [Candidatus Acetothermia bacterium]MDH7504755.1 proton-conducting transporter membrane subunit [Candidatus Acetothermia bacterium]